MIKKFKNKSGFIMVEILIGAFIVVGCILAAMDVSQKSISVSRQALHTAQASFLLEEGAENARIARDNAWSNVSSINTSESVDIFTRTVVASNAYRNATTGDIASTGTSDTDAKLITVTVSWKEGAQTVSKTLSFYLFNIFS
jgi:Tfp pilus assembly protein PilV